MDFYNAFLEKLESEFPNIKFKGMSFDNQNMESPIEAILKPLPTGRFAPSDLRIDQNFQLQIRVRNLESNSASVELDNLLRFFNPQFQQERPIQLGRHKIHHRSSNAAVPLGDRDSDGSYLWEIIVSLNYSNNALTGTI